MRCLQQDRLPKPRGNKAIALFAPGASIASRSASTSRCQSGGTHSGELLCHYALDQEGKRSLDHCFNCLLEERITGLVAPKPGQALSPILRVAGNRPATPTRLPRAEEPETPKSRQPQPEARPPTTEEAIPPYSNPPSPWTGRRSKIRRRRRAGFAAARRRT